MQITLQIDPQSSKGVAFLDYIRAIANTDNFLVIKKESVEAENPIMQQIEQGLREVKQIKEGTLRSKSLNELINELD